MGHREPIRPVAHLETGTQDTREDTRDDEVFAKVIIMLGSMRVVL